MGLQSFFLQGQQTHTAGDREGCTVEEGMPGPPLLPSALAYYGGTRREKSLDEPERIVLRRGTMGK